MYGKINHECELRGKTRKGRRIKFRMSYGPPRSGTGSSHWGGPSWDYSAGDDGGDNYHTATYGPPTTSYYGTTAGPSYTGIYDDSTAYYPSSQPSAFESQGTAAYGGTAADTYGPPLHYSPPPPHGGDEFIAEEEWDDMAEVMRDATKEDHRTEYRSKGGKLLATKTITPQAGIDDKFAFPANDHMGNLPTYRKTRDFSPERTPQGRERLQYRRSRAGPRPVHAFAHYRGGSEDSLGRVTYDYRTPARPGDDPRDEGGLAGEDAVGVATRRQDSWGSEELDRWTVPTGWSAHEAATRRRE